MIESIISIDPGLTGAISVLNIKCGYLDIYDMPIRLKSEKTQARIKNIVDANELGKILSQYSANKSRIVIEASNAMRKKQNEYQQGSSTLYSTAHTSGMIQGVCEALCFQVDFVMPHIWKKYLNLGTNKRESCKLAAKLFPQSADEFKRVSIDHNRAESALILYYYINKKLNLEINKKKDQIMFNQFLDKGVFQ